MAYSDPPANAVATPHVQARLLHGLLQQLGIEKASLVGHSWGGLLALLYALEYPDEVSGLVLLAPGSMRRKPRLRAPLSAARSPSGRSDRHRLYDAPQGMLIRANLAEAFAPDPVPIDYAKMAQALWLRRPRQTKVFAREKYGGRPVMRALAARYPDLRLPVLLVTGEADRVVSPEQHALRLHRAIPHSELRTLVGAGHELLHTRPEAAVDAIARFWARRPRPYMDSDFRFLFTGRSS